MNQNDPARARFFLLTALRIAAVAFILFGVLIASQRVAGFAGDSALYLGTAMALIGFAELFILVPFLTRRWRSPS